MGIFDTVNVYDGVWPVGEDGNPIFSKIVQDNLDFEQSFVDNIYGDQEYFSTIGQNPYCQR